MKKNINEQREGIWGENLKSLKSLMRNFVSVQSDNTDKTDKAIFATFATFAMQIYSNLVNLVNLVIQIFHKGSYSAVRAMSVQQPTNLQRISNLSPTVRPTYNRFTTNSVLSRICLVSLILMSVGVGNAWGDETVVFDGTADWGNNGVEKFSPDSFKIDASHVTFALKKDMKQYNTGSGKKNHQYFYLENGNTAQLRWWVDEGYTIKVSAVSFMAHNNRATIFSEYGKSYVHTTRMKQEERKNFSNQGGWERKTFALSDTENNLFGATPLANDEYFILTETTNEGQLQSCTLTYTLSPNTYTINYNGNATATLGGSMLQQTLTYDGTTALNNVGFTNGYTVRFEKNGGDAVSDMAANSTFLGWATSSDGAVVYANQQDFNEALKTNNGITLNLYAKWGAVPSVTLPAASKDGYTFDGWYIGETRIGGAGDSFTPTRDTTVTAHWTSKYTPRFYYNGGTTSFMVDDEQAKNAFRFENTPNLVAHIDVISIDDVNNGDGQVIEYDATNKRLIAHNAGRASIYFTQAETDEIFKDTSSTWTFTVSKYETSFTGSAYNLMVEGTQTANYSYTNTSAVKPTANSADDFYYAVENVEFANSALNSGTNLVTFNPDDKLITACNAGTGKITFRQKETYKYTGDTVSYNVAVYKYNSVFSREEDLDVLVDEDVQSNYVLTYTKPDAGYVGAADHVAGAPTEGESSGNFYFTLSQNVTTDNTKDSPNGELATSYNAGTKTATGLNQGTSTVRLYQKETYKYKAATTSFDVTVSKHTTNVLSKTGITTIYADKTSSPIVLSASENTDYANNPIYVEYVDAVHDPDTMAYTYNANTRTVNVISNYKYGSVTWRYWQEENYKFTATENRFTVAVIREPESTDCEDVCVLNDPSLKEWETISGTGEYLFSEPGRKLIFQAYREEMATFFSTNSNFFAEYSTTTNTDSWVRLCENLDLPESKVWKEFKFDIPADAKRVRVRTELGAQGYRKVKNVRVTRRNGYLTSSVDTVRISRTAESNPVYPVDVAGVGQFVIDRFLANGGDLRIYNDNSAIFKLSKTIISDVDCKSGEDIIGVSYEPTMAGNDTARLIIYNDVYRDTVVVTGVCVKHQQHGRWKDNISTVQNGVEIENAYSSTMSGTHGVSYSILSGSSVVIDGNILKAVSAGVTRVRAYVVEDALYEAIADTIDITVTNDEVQYIVWDQDYELTHLTVGGSNVTLNAYADSEVESDTTNGPVATFLRPITYSIKAGEATNVVSVSGNTLTILGAGQTILVATQAGGTDGDKHVAYAATSMEQRVYVRSELSPVAGGEYYLYNFNDSTHLNNNREDGVRQELVTSTKEYILFEGKSNKSRTTCTFAHEPAYAIIYSKNNGSGKGTVYVDQLIGGIWERVWSKTSFVSSWTPDTVPLSRNATQVCAGIDQDKNYIYFGGLKVVMAKYIEVVEDGISKETLGFSTFINTPQTKELQLRYSDVKGNILLSLEEGAPFTLNTEEIAASEHDANSVNLRITYKNSRTEENGQYKLTISDGAITREITLNASARTDSCQFQAEGNWEDNSENWTKLPNENLSAKIEENVQITISTEVSVYSLEIEEGASVVVTPTGGLSVGAGGVSGVGMENIEIQVDDDPESEKYGISGYVRISPDYEGTMPHVAMQAYSKAYYNVAGNDAKWQYIGSPIKDNVLAKSVFTNSYIYTWDESQGKWLNKRSNMRLQPFKGYATTQKTDADGIVLTFEGELVDHRNPQVIELQYTEGSPEAGCNVLANSFAAPIDISRLRPEDFSEGVEATIHLFNTGSNADIAAREEAGAVNVAAEGQYISVPYKTARSLHALSDYPIVIPSMQGFYIQTNKPGTVTLNYERLVWEADYGKYENQPLRIVGRGGYREVNDDEEDELTGSLKMTLYTPSGVDHLILLESESYSAEFENGYDAHKLMSGDLNIFAVENEDQLSVDATNSIVGTRIGVRTGESDMYTIAFSKVNGEKALILADLEAEQIVDINEGSEYTFFIEPNSEITSRFVILEAEAPSVATGIDEATSEGAKVRKFIKDEKVYILKNGVIYDVTGKRVK